MPHHPHARRHRLDRQGDAVLTPGPRGRRTNDRLYQIDLTLGTLADSLINLYDFDGNDSGWADNYGETPTSQSPWESYFSQEAYLLVQSASGATGTYTLTITEVAADAPTP